MPIKLSVHFILMIMLLICQVSRNVNYKSNENTKNIHRNINAESEENVYENMESSNVKHSSFVSSL